MATTANLSSIIRYYAEKQNSPVIDLKDFCIYIKKYAQHHVEEQGELVKYLGDTNNIVTAELKGLVEKHLVSIVSNNNKKLIISIGYFVTKYTAQYREILANESITYPISTDMPKNFPFSALETKNAESYIPEMLGKDTSKYTGLYVLYFSKDLPSMILPACIPMDVLFETAQSKIRRILKKDEYHDYFMKKLRQSNPTKEISLKNFFTHFVDKNQTNYYDFQEDDEYYLWNQLLYYIREDFAKIQDRTTDDINILQAIRISEIHSTFLKSKFLHESQHKQAMLKLESSMNEPPYFFSMTQILKFQDQNGTSLFKTLSDNDLIEFIQTRTQNREATQLPDLLVFRVESGTRYYVFKNHIIQIIVRLCNEAHVSIEKQLIEKWYNSLLEYEKLREMTDKAAFEKTLDKMVHDNSPVLHSLLNANFMNLLALEKDTNEESADFNIFAGSSLLPLSSLLMLDNTPIYSNARSMLPFIYTVPFISWLIGIFKVNKKNKEKAKKAEEKKKEPETQAVMKVKSKGAELADTAKELAKEMIPEGSTLDRELDYLCDQWNQMISKEAHIQLTDDVNALIRDYTRRVVKTVSYQSFNRDRVENLANTLCRSPNLQKIKDQKALKEYVALYILRLVSNTK